MLSFEILAEKAWRDRSGRDTPYIVDKFRIIYVLLFLTCGICGFIVLALSVTKLGFWIAIFCWLVGGALSLWLNKIFLVNAFITSGLLPPIAALELLWG